jgi:hypothetical protein
LSIKENPFFSYSLNVTGFLGGITFAAMILIIESKDRFQAQFPVPSFLSEQIPFFNFIEFPELLIVGTAFVSVLFIIATVGYIRVAAGEKNAKNPYTWLLGKLSLVGFYSLVLGLLPGLIYPFSSNGALFIFLLSLGIVILLAKLHPKS